MENINHLQSNGVINYKLQNKMLKKQQVQKPFKRKTSSMKEFLVQVRRNQDQQLLRSSSKYLSPKRVTGLDCGYYRREESLVRTLQEEINRLKRQLDQIKVQNLILNEENQHLKKIIEDQSEKEKNKSYQDLVTFDVLNELKQKIDLMDGQQDDQLSTFDQIEISDVCNCSKFERQIKEQQNSLKDKQKTIKFLEDSLLSSHSIINKLQQQVHKLKVFIDRQHREKIKLSNSSRKSSVEKSLAPSMEKLPVAEEQQSGKRHCHSQKILSKSSRQVKSSREKLKYRISSIQQIIEETDQQHIKF